VRGKEKDLLSDVVVRVGHFAGAAGVSIQPVRVDEDLF
jgi:hypothetical protein